MTSIAFQLRREIVINKTAVRIIGCSIFVILTAIGAYIRIPLFFTPVPITLQTFVVLLSGAVLGRRLGPLSQAVYVAAGAFGLPVFQGYGYGVSHIFGPTGGYLFGFVAASFIAGYLAKDRTAEKGMTKIFLTMITALAVIYFFGVAWLKLFLGTSLSSALILGLYPFIPGEVVKVIAASYICKGFKSRI
jgi:biotin transport system substrate-specific component